MNNRNFWERLQSYTEIIASCLVLYVIAILIAIGATFAWKALSKGESVRWEVFVIAGVIGLLPLLIIAAKVWEVNLSLFGNRAASENNAGKKADPPLKVVGE